MTPKSKHDQIAEQLAKALKTTYNPSKGVDIKKRGMVAEIEPTPKTFTDGIRQLRPYKGCRYLVTDDRYINEAVERVKNTKIGVMKPNGTVVKPATVARRKK
ncbi:hypothetical protein M1N19_02910 [Dehalococcoidia bacterium]|nr:hypothetical protein [Dehalococcoidia bacterium]MCL0039180.1 hypothetical protein [Dehalococcoidia bacterium]MCL0093086.1 hypothetical protein [Dehalococcoidia bacterium]